MAMGVLGWRVMPYGRSAHLVSWDPAGARGKYVTACGATEFVSHVVDSPQAKRCKRCVRASIRHQCRQVRPYAGGFTCCRLDQFHEGLHIDYHGVSSGPWCDRDQTPCNCEHVDGEHCAPAGGCGADDCKCDGFSLSHILDVHEAMTATPSRQKEE